MDFTGYVTGMTLLLAGRWSRIAIIYKQAWKELKKLQPKCAYFVFLSDNMYVDVFLITRTFKGILNLISQKLSQI